MLASRQSHLLHHLLRSALLVAASGLIATADLLAQAAPGSEATASARSAWLAPEVWLLLGWVVLGAGVLRLVLLRRGDRAEIARLRHTSMFSTQLFVSQRTPLLVMDAETGEYVDCNPAAVEAFGVERREDLLGRTQLDFSGMHQEGGAFSSQRALQYLRQASEQGEAQFEWTHRRPDGEQWPASVHLRRLDRPGRDLLLYSVEDLTPRKRAEEALRTANQRIKLHIEQTPMAVIEWDLAFRVVRWNPAAESIFGYTATEAIGRYASFIVPEAERDQVTQVWALLVSKQGGKRSQNDNQTRDGRTITCEWYNTPLVNERGRVIGVASLVRDITERRHAEEEKSQLEEQLRQAQKMEAVGQLAGGIAHDFNNLLQVIIGNLDLLRRRRGTPEPGSEQDTMRKAAMRAAELTRQLLAFSRRQVMAPIDLDLNELVGGVLKMVRRLIGEHIELHFVAGEGLGSVHADRVQLEQVLMNLCVNARDAMPEGGRLTLRIDRVTDDDPALRVLRKDDGTHYLRLGVSDTGHGMDSTTRQRIFEPFFTTKEVGRGTGLGLSMVYGIIKQHQGLIDVTSHPGAGTTFWIYLPMSTCNVADEWDTDAQPAVLGGTETILVAEDEASVLSLVNAVLTGAGYTVLTACDGEAAWELYRAEQRRIDLVMLDMIMPRLSGRALFDRIRAENPGMRFLLTSGYSDRALDADLIGETRLLQKPYETDALLRTLREVLGRESSPVPAEEAG